jgi:HAD superfamily hydrolase (TIGR01458 family)
MGRRPPDILRKSHAHASGNDRADAKRLLQQELADTADGGRRALLIDLDGVVYVGSEPVPGAPEVIGWLTEHDVPHVFVTNTTSKPRASVVGKLASLGIDVAAERVLTPAIAAAAWLRERAAGRAALFVPPATRADFAGVAIAEPGEGADVVVVGDYGERWTFGELNRAFRLLIDARDPALVALGMTRYWQAPEGLRLDTAPFVAALAQATGIEPVVLGKPAPEFFSIALEMLGATPARTWMIGDDICTDVRGAQDAGIHGVLVRTGKYRSRDRGGNAPPDAELASIAELPSWWMTNAQA